MWNDLLVAGRVLRKSPIFTIVAVATLAVGIAATASFFALVNGLVRDPLPYPDPERLVEVWGKDVSSPFDFMPLSTPDYLDLRDRVSHVAELGAFTVRRFNLGGEQPEAVEGARCTAGLLPAYGVRPLHGRWFTREDESRDAALVILSHALWTRRFGSDPAAIGRTLRLDGCDHTIVGIMPRDFTMLAAMTRNRTLGVWTLLPLPRGEGGRASYWLAAIARMKPGASRAAATAELREIARQLAKANPQTNARRTFWLMPLSRQIGGMAALRVSILLFAGWALLALACKNVAGMLLARGVSRESEMAIRVALGARRSQIARLVVAESLLLSLAASACGLVLTLACLRVLPALLPVEVLPHSGLHVDGWLLACIVILTLIVAQMAGTTPALLAAKTGGPALRESGGGAGGGRRVTRKLRGLVVGQVAVAVALVGAALQLSGTYRQMLASTRAAASDQIMTAAIAVRGDRYDAAARAAFWDGLLARASALPGVLDAGVTTKLPFAGGVCMGVLVDDAAYEDGRSAPCTEVSFVSPGFFGAIGTPLLQGRVLNDADARVQFQSVLVNRTMAARYWPGQSPIGRHIRQERAFSAVIVGVVGDLRQVAERPAKPEMFFSYSDDPGEEALLVVRSVPGATAPVQAIREIVRQIDPDLAVADVKTMADRFVDATGVFSTVTVVLDGLTVAILGLAGIGLYSAVSFYFAQRCREIGVRMALGARSRDISLLVLRQALTWAAVGGAFGVALLGGLTLGLRAALQDAEGVDVAQLAASLAVVGTAALAATYLPARRAAKVDPMVALRCE